MTPTIRPAAPHDIAAITRIYDHAVRFGTATFETEPPDEAEMARRMDALSNGGFPYLVAQIDDAVAGYAYAGPYRTRIAYRWTVEDSIYLAPEYQRQGIGLRLLQALIAVSERRGFRQLVAVIGDSAQLGSIAVHRQTGFALIGTLTSVGYKHGRWLDTVLMQRTLGHGDKLPPTDQGIRPSS